MQIQCNSTSKTHKLIHHHFEINLYQLNALNTSPNHGYQNLGFLITHYFLQFSYHTNPFQQAKHDQRREVR